MVYMLVIPHGTSSMTTPVRQMIDHSKLEPLLTKTIQELERIQMES